FFRRRGILGRRRIFWWRRRLGGLVKMIGALTRDERQRIHAATEAIERRTSADLDLVVVRASDRYSLYPIAWAATAAILIAAIVAILRPGIGARILIVIQLVTLVTLTLISYWLPIRLALVP